MSGMRIAGRRLAPPPAMTALLCAALWTAPIAAQPVDAPAPRPSLLPLVQPLWSDLTAAQQSVLQPFEPQWNTLPLAEKRAWVELANRFPRMSQDAQRRVERRIVQWAALTPEQRELARANFRLAKELPKDERVADWESYRAMTPEQRAVLGTAGTTSNTAAGHAGAPTGLAKEAAQPLPRRAPGRDRSGTAAGVEPALTTPAATVDRHGVPQATTAPVDSGAARMATGDAAMPTVPAAPGNSPAAPPDR